MRIALVGLLAILIVGCEPSVNSLPASTLGAAATVQPSSEPSPSPSAPSPTATSEPPSPSTPRSSSTPERSALNPGDRAFVITDNLRVRSKPGLGPESETHWPLLQRNMVVWVLAEPRQADGYWWVYVNVGDWTNLPCAERQHQEGAYGVCFPDQFPSGNEGWIATGHDGTAWLAKWVP